MSNISINMVNYILEHFKYNAETGIITRTDRVNSNGSYDKDGYLIIKIKGRQFKAHRLAWLLYYKEFPKQEIDHINRNRADNRICNLRDVSRSVNVCNTTKKINKSTGLAGVYISNAKGLKKKFTVSFKSKTYRFYTLEEAVEFRRKCDEQRFYS